METGPGKETKEMTQSCCIEEVELIERCRRGSRGAFEPIVEKYMKDAYYIALGLVGNREDALDLSQEAFAKAYINISSLNSKWGFFPWFYQILRNLCFSHLRKRKVRRAHSIEQLTEDGAVAFESDCESPEDPIEEKEMKQGLWEAIGQLDEKHKEVIILRHFKNMSYDEMAKALFTNKGTVTSRLYYARQKLKDILERQRDPQTRKEAFGEPRKGGRQE